jgi:hypothetical protein
MHQQNRKTMNTNGQEAKGKTVETSASEITRWRFGLRDSGRY